MVKTRSYNDQKALSQMKYLIFLKCIFLLESSSPIHPLGGPSCIGISVPLEHVASSSLQNGGATGFWHVMCCLLKQLCVQLWEIMK